LAGSAFGAEPRIAIEAVLYPRLDHLDGTLCWEGEEPAGFEDYLGALPVPPDDRTALRTWPWGPSTGSVSWSEGEGSCVDFEARFPDRYGAVGRVPGRGLFVNGGWYPVPVDPEGRVTEARWAVELHLPPDVAGAVGGAAGEGLLRWEGRGERVGLAAIPGGRVERLESAAGELRLLSRRGVAGARERWLLRALETVQPEAEPLELVVVDAPLMRRLARPGPGLLFLSDRAFRVSPGLRHLHLEAVGQGLLAAGLAGALPAQRERDYVAAALVAQAMGGTPSAQGLLRWFAWLPQIDELLYSGSVPYVSEVMGEPWPGDTLQDDLLEVQDPRLPGAVVVGRAAARGLPVEATAAALLAGSEPPSWMSGHPSSSADQNYALREVAVADGATRVVLERDAPGHAPPEPLVVAFDGERVLVELDEGPALRNLELPEARSVVLDPDGLLLQTDRADDRWPSRWTTVLSAFPTVWNLSSGRMEGYLALRFRRQHDTRWYYDTFLFRDEVDAVGAQAAVGHSWGPLQDRRWRPYRLYLRASGSLLDPDFRPTEQGRYAVDLGATFAWDTQVDWLFPLRGHYLSVSGHTGFVPASPQRWAGLGAVLGGVASPHPRVALAGEARLGRSWGEVEHRLQVLGGVNNLRSMPADYAVGDAKLLTRGELRVAPLRHVSVPIGIAWLDELQLSGGLEAGVLSGARLEGSLGEPPPDGWVRAAGWTGGCFVVIDVLGGQPALAGLVLAGPIAAEPLSLGEASPSLYLLWEQAF
jgi:hypothetical protein